MLYAEKDRIAPREIVKGYWARFIHTQYMTICFWEVEEGAVMPMHQHINEQTSQVLEGQFELTVAGETKLLETGLVVIIPPNVQHGGVAVTACRLLDIFSPVREDYK